MNSYFRKAGLFFLCSFIGLSCAAIPLSVNAKDSGENITVQEQSSTKDGKAHIKDITFSPGKDESEINFTWYSSNNLSAQVEIALKSDMTNSEFPSEKSKLFKGEISNGDDGYFSNKVTVTGLKDHMSYVYRVGDGTNWSDVENYTTEDTSEFNFLFAGDPQIGASGDILKDGEGWQDTIKKATSKFSNASFLLSIGDQVNNGKEVIDGNNEPEYNEYFKPQQLRNIPIAAISGNHEGYGKGHITHFNIPNMSDKYGIFTSNGYETDKSSGTTGNDYYFVYGNTLFLMLNSNDINAEDHKQFMEEAIAQNPNVKWKIVGMHHSIYSSATHETDADIAQRRITHPQVFQELGIDVVLDGHDHVYTRSCQMEDGNAVSDKNDTNVTDPNGVLYVTANSASGSKYYEIQEPNYNNYYEAKKEQIHVPTFSDIKMTDKSFTITTYRTDTMEVTDTYTINKTSNHKNVSRLAGKNRYETAAKVSKNKWDSADSVVLVSGESFADALSAAPFANSKKAPLLLTEKAFLDTYTKNEISRLKARTAYIVGGIGSVSKNVEDTLRNMNIVVKRISGSDRYETSLAVAKSMKNIKDIFMASGKDFPDGLSVSSYAALTGSPILLTDGSSVDSNISTYIKSSNVKCYIVGGKSVVGDNVLKEINGERISGEDRYKTNIAVLDKFKGDYSKSSIYIASGSNFADALSASAAAGSKKAPVILVGNSVPDAVSKYVKSSTGSVGQITVLGGESVVPQGIINEILK